MEKVKLPKEVAEAIEALRSRDFEVSNHDILFIFAESYNNGYPALVRFCQTNFDTLLQALVNGYEVELTPEERIRDVYNLYNSQSENGRDCRDVIRVVLNILDVKIEGVNA